MRQELLELYFIVCFNKIEHFIRDSACNYVRNVAQWEHYTSTRALELICPAPHHQLTRASYGCNCNYQPCHLRSKHGNKFQITTGWQLLTLLIFVNVAVKMSFCSPKYHWPLPDITDFSCLGSVGQPQFEYHNSDPLMLSLSAMEMNFNISWQNDYIV